MLNVGSPNKAPKRAGVEDFSPHDLRRSYVSDLLERDANLRDVQRLVGHSSPQTTAGYDRRGEHAKHRAARMLSVPYVRVS